MLRRNGSGCWIDSNYFGIIGYSDDTFLLAPSLDALQEMVNVCEEYANIHNLTFSTDKDPIKCKTKCLAFLKRERILKNIMLCGDPLPWVSNGKHLGNWVENKIDGMKKDIKTKRAAYIDKNNDLIQEFYFAHPKTKLEVNQIFNCHFTGSPLWDLFSREAEMLFNTWNRSVRLMCDISFRTHRYFIEPLAGRHLKITLMKRFLGFIQQIERSPKMLPNLLLQTIRKDARSTTGSNLRNILLLTQKHDSAKLVPSDISELEYVPIDEENKWKINMVNELIDVKWGKTCIEDFSTEEIDDILDNICTS